MIKYLFLLALLSSAFTNPTFDEEPYMKPHLTHPYPSDSPNITVHVIPHSHDDVGWLKTVDEYFYGAAQTIQFAAVQYTIDTVVDQLWMNPSYKFVIVEMAFLSRWWDNASEDQKQRIKEIVKRGQLKFINGGWCMSDQATLYYEDFIDQMTIGLKWLKQTFNYVPDIAWQIDPFGHEASSATLFSKMGFQALFFARIDYQDKDKRLSEKSLQMIWKPELTVQEASNYIFTHVNYYLYRSPPGYCFDNRCPTEEPIKDDEKMEDYNLVTRSNELVDYFKSMSLHYRSTNIMHNFGGDFQYSNAKMYFKNIDKLMKYINSKPEYGVKLIYSTPDEYITAIRKEEISYPTKEDDFLPYADSQHSYWTGFFTSRVALKGFVRDFGRWLQSVRKHISELKISNYSTVILSQVHELQESMWEMQTAMGILQHHDAVSGTEKQRVADDYIYTAVKAISRFTGLYKKIVKEQISKEIGETVAEENIYFNIYWNQTAKETGVANKILNNKTFILSLYNPGEAQKRQIRLSVPEHELKILDQKNNFISGDVFCVDTINPENCELVFNVDMPESGNKYVKITSVKSSGSAKVIKSTQMRVSDATKTFKLSNQASIKITRASQQFDLTLGKNTESFLIGYNYYESYQGDGQKSGAYIFRPASDTAKQFSSIKSIYYAEGTQNVIIILIGDRTQTKLAFSKIENYVNNYGFSMETYIDSIPIDDKIGKEVTLNFATNVMNHDTFYTDSNGLEEQKRVLNFRPTWKLDVNQAVAGNYYPINSHIRIQSADQSNAQKKVTILPDRSQGGTVLKDGKFQMMIHRRLLEDDSKGVNEALNETSSNGKGLTQRVRHYVVFGDSYRNVQVKNDQKVRIAIAETNSSPFSKVTIRSCPFKVPSGVKLYMRPNLDGSYLVRIQSFLLEEVSVNMIDGWFISQLTLAANQFQKDWQSSQYSWNEQANEEKEGQWWNWVTEKAQNLWSELGFQEEENQAIKLHFLQIRTFKLAEIN